MCGARATQGVQLVRGVRIHVCSSPYSAVQCRSGRTWGIVLCARPTQTWGINVRHAHLLPHLVASMYVDMCIPSHLGGSHRELVARPAGPRLVCRREVRVQHAPHELPLGQAVCVPVSRESHRVQLVKHRTTSVGSASNAQAMAIREETQREGVTTWPAPSSGPLLPTRTPSRTMSHFL